MNLRHNLRFFKNLVDQGRPDLAAQNAAADGRFRLALYFARRDGLSARQAWTLVWRWYRMDVVREEDEKLTSLFLEAETALELD